MGKTILPSGEAISITPEEILRYLNPDGLRQMMRQERLRWLLKPNRDADYYDNEHLFKYTSQLHNDGRYMKMEIHTYPDNDAYEGYAGVFVDSGNFGIPHKFEKWGHALSDESIRRVINRVFIGATAKVKDKLGYGLSDEDKDVTKTENRAAAIILDPYDGRGYLLSSDDPNYVNNATRQADEKLPQRTIARIGDIPTHVTDLINDFDFVSDPDYRHTDNNFTNSNRYLLDNLDDRTFVYPEIARDKSGDYIENYRVGLDGEPGYGESDGMQQFNSQPDLGEHPELGDHGDRLGEAVNSYGANQSFASVHHRPGYLPGIFRSLEELERVDLVDQVMDIPTHKLTPGAKRSHFYYKFDGVWSPNWYDRVMYNDSYLANSLNPANMESAVDDRQPIPLSRVPQAEDPFNMTKLYQWRYNRVTILYHSKDIRISIKDPGEQYRVGDILRWSFADDVFTYEVTSVGVNGEIQTGHYRNIVDRVFEQDPSTGGTGIRFTNMSGVGRGATLVVSCSATITTHATQIKNNLYAYVDVTPTVRSDNTTPWSDVNLPDSQGGKVNIRSTAAGPGYTGINSGRGGPVTNEHSDHSIFHEHGGNATAGVHVHLFRYVIDTQNPVWLIRDGIQVFTGKWVDQGPMGLERPCDIKALLFSNPDTNNFNNYYKFSVDSLFDSLDRNPDGSMNPSAVAMMYIHNAECDPKPDQRFYVTRFDPNTSTIKYVDVTDRVQYVNGATGAVFHFNSTYRNDPKYGYGMKPPGWFAVSGGITK